MAGIKKYIPTLENPTWICNCVQEVQGYGWFSRTEVRGNVLEKRVVSDSISGNNKFIAHIVKPQEGLALDAKNPILLTIFVCMTSKQEHRKPG